LLPYDWFKKWEGTDWHKRGDDYKALKEELAQPMLEQLYRVAPQLRGKVDHYEVSTPLSTKHFSGHPHGEIYGASHTPKRFRQDFLRAHTPVKNLFLTGQDIITCSIAGGTMGGMLCASAVLKKNLLWTVKNEVK
jgi:all-trans-retinol 13,14-reductase